MNPKSSQEKSSLSFHLARMATFHECGVMDTGPFNIENVSKSAVSACTIGYLLRDIAIPSSEA